MRHELSATTGEAIAAYVAVGHRPERFTRLVALAVPHIREVDGASDQPEQLKRSWYIFFFQTPLADLVVPNDDFAVVDMLWRDWSPGGSFLTWIS